VREWTNEGHTRAVLWLERVLVVVGLTCLGWYGYVSLATAFDQRDHTAAVERALSAPVDVQHVDGVVRPTDVDVSRASPADAVPVNLIGMLEIPRLGLSTPVMNGDDQGTLRDAAGHLPDTPQPWEPGNSAIAAHRDGVFRPLKQIKVGDEVHVRTTHGDLQYRVREIKIVTPRDLSVLEPTDAQTLTLITCYPFNYVGSAPKRFIVRAERVVGGVAPF